MRDVLLLLLLLLLLRLVLLVLGREVAEVLLGVEVVLEVRRLVVAVVVLLVEGVVGRRRVLLLVLLLLLLEVLLLVVVGRVVERWRRVRRLVDVVGVRVWRRVEGTVPLWVEAVTTVGGGGECRHLASAVGDKVPQHVRVVCTVKEVWVHLRSRCVRSVTST